MFEISDARSQFYNWGAFLQLKISKPANPHKHWILKKVRQLFNGECIEKKPGIYLNYKIALIISGSMFFYKFSFI